MTSRGIAQYRLTQEVAALGIEGLQARYNQELNWIEVPHSTNDDVLRQVRDMTLRLGLSCEVKRAPEEI